jgi:nucleotide-binding universal stress UspA family protein
MSTGSRTSTILVAVDGSPASRAAVAWAAHESSIRHAPVRLMHVISPAVLTVPPEPMFYGLEWYENNARQIVEHAAREIRSSSAPPRPVSTTIGEGNIVRTLADATKDALVAVVGSRGIGGVKRLALGSVSSGLLHHAHCPVAVIRADKANPRADAPVLVGIDGSPASEAATALAFDEASRRGIDLVALHAWSDFGAYMGINDDWRRYEDEAHEVLAERLAGWQEQYPDVAVRRRIVCDAPAYRLTEESRQAQLVVVGSHGRGGFTGMVLGSTSSAVVQTSSAPVIVARA